MVRLEREAREADPEKELKWCPTPPSCPPRPVPDPLCVARRSFKALEKTAVLLFGMGHYEEGIEVFRELLKHMDTVTRNECAESLNNVLDAAAAMGSEHSSVMTSVGAPGQLRRVVYAPTPLTARSRAAAAQVFRTTLEVLKAQHHDRLWFNTSVKLARMYLDLQDTAELRRVIDELYQCARPCAPAGGSAAHRTHVPRSVCEPVSAHEDASKSTMLMEVYALDIQVPLVPLQSHCGVWDRARPSPTPLRLSASAVVRYDRRFAAHEGGVPQGAAGAGRHPRPACNGVRAGGAASALFAQ